MINPTDLAPQPLKLGKHEVIKTENADGTIVLSNAEPLNMSDTATMLDYMDYWAQQTPNMVFLRERISDGWAEISYSQFQSRVISTARHLATLPISPEKPLLVVAPNSINHVVVGHAAMVLGIPYTPISVAYAQIGESFERLNSIIDIVQPGAIYFSDSMFFERAIEATHAKYDIPLITSHAHSSLITEIKDLETVDEEVVLAKRAEVTQDTVCKILMTSGSTGIPKGVVNTHRMLYSNQVATEIMWPFLKDPKPNMVEWLPWSHTFGGNLCFNIALYHGGTLTIDDGKPIPALIGRTVENICMIRPNVHFNVPVGIEALVNQIEDNRNFGKRFFSAVRMIFVAGAALPDKTKKRLVELANEYTDVPPKIFAGWGSTETAPFATCVNFDTESVSMGVPMPGTQIKMTPSQDKLALSVSGPNVTPGYWRNEKASSEVFDEEGFYAMGDAGRLIDENDPSKGLMFEGRISENFKLASGTWVNVNQIRLAAVTALKPLVMDCVITGHNENDIGILMVPNIPAIAKQYNIGEDDQTAAYFSNLAPLVEELRSRLVTYNKNCTSNSTRIGRFSFLPNMPSVDKNEITDKGYLNQRSLLSNYADLVTAMYEAEFVKPITYYAFA